MCQQRYITSPPAIHHTRTWLGIRHFSDGQLHPEKRWMKLAPGWWGKTNFFLVYHLSWRPGASEQQDIRCFPCKLPNWSRKFWLQFCGKQVNPTPKPQNIRVSFHQQYFSLEPTLLRVLPQEGVIFSYFVLKFLLNYMVFKVISMKPINLYRRFLSLLSSIWFFFHKGSLVAGGKVFSCTIQGGKRAMISKLRDNKNSTNSRKKDSI